MEGPQNDLAEASRHLGSFGLIVAVVSVAVLTSDAWATFQVPESFMLPALACLAISVLASLAGILAGVTALFLPGGRDALLGLALSVLALVPLAAFAWVLVGALANML